MSFAVREDGRMVIGSVLTPLYHTVTPADPQTCHIPVATAPKAGTQEIGSSPSPATTMLSDIGKDRLSFLGLRPLTDVHRGMDKSKKHRLGSPSACSAAPVEES